MNNGEYNFQPEVKRTYTPEEAGHDRIRKPVSRMSRKKNRRVNVGVLIVCLVFTVIVGVCVYLLASGKNRDDASLPGNSGENESVNDVITNNPGGGDHGGGADAQKYEGTETSGETPEGKPFTVTVSEEQMHMGDLILVNYAYPYAFAESEVSRIQTVTSAKNEFYLARDSKVSLRSDFIEVINTLMEDMYEVNGNKYMQVNSAYRSYQEQVDTYEYYKNTNGEEYAKNYVATPGYSEHHTGLAVDFNVYKNGYIYYVESYDGCAWFRENAKEYGIVLRYEPDKTYITGINGETWHYRYVGAPHAEIMYDLDLCLEEYIDYVKDYTIDKMLCYDGENLISMDAFEEGEDVYGVYFVPSQGEETRITIPENVEYSISGNNVDGYIVTLTK